MAVNKVNFMGRTLIDLTQDTVLTASDLAEGCIGHLADGTQVVGTTPKWIMEKLDDDLTGLTVLYENENLAFSGTSGDHIIVNELLFSQDNISKDFKIILQNLYQDNSVGTGSSANERCILGAMKEVSPYPGILIRVGSGSGVVGIKARYTYPSVVIKRLNGTISVTYVSVNGQGITVGNMGNAATPHDTPISLGCELDASGNPYRYTKGSIGKIIIAMA